MNKQQSFQNAINATLAQQARGELTAEQAKQAINTILDAAR